MKKANKKAAYQADQSKYATNENTSAVMQIHPNNNINNSKCQMYCLQDISDLIRVGEKNAIHLSELVSLTKINSRELRKHIEQLRRSGTAIISNNNGYFKPSNAAELNKYIAQETRRAKSIFYTLRAAKAALRCFGETQA